MQQSRYNDIQLLQQHLMLKQLQELQRQQQLPQLCDVRQQNSINYPFASAKQAAGDTPQFPLINGTYLSDTSHTNWDNRGAPSFLQGLPNPLNPSLDQGQALHLTGLLPQRVGTSIYGSPVPSRRDDESRSSHLRGISPETANLANKIIDQQQPLSCLQSSAFGTSQLAVSSEQVCMSEAPFMIKQEYIYQNMFGEVQPQSHSSGMFMGTVQPDNVMQTNTSVQEFGWKQDQNDWLRDMQQKPDEMVPLDPLEKKILYNSDDSTWDASFGNFSDAVPGGSENTSEPMDTCPSLYSGSWSALMQSAVAETSSGDTGLTEEWSGLTYQNPENSTDNQPSVMDSGKPQMGWADNSLQSPFSLTSSPSPVFNNPGMSPSVHVFQPSSVQSLSNQHSGLHQDVSHGADQKPVTNAIEWLDRYSKQNLSLQGNQQLQTHSHLNAWSAQNYGYAEGDKNPQTTTPPYDDSRRSIGQGKGENDGALYQLPNASSALGNANSGYAVDNWRLAGGLEQMQTAASILTGKREEPRMDNFMGIQNSSTERSQQGANQHVQAQNQPNAMSQVDLPIHDKESRSTQRTSDQITGASPLHQPLKAINEVYLAENMKDTFACGEHGQVNVSDIGTNLAKESASSGGNLKESEGISSVINSQPNKSFPFDATAGPNYANITTLMSVAEKDWAQATNRLIEKFQEELEKIKEKRPKLLARRRLLLSTQLMQQLLRAPPAATLSVDAASTYDSLTYHVAKVTIGDACTLTNYHNSGSCLPSNNSNRIHEKVEPVERDRNGYFSKAVEDFVSRAKELEGVLTSLEKATAFVDIYAERQDLERYTIINRFARFHIRGPPSNSSSRAAPPHPRASPQLYVTGRHPGPVPEVGKCLSL